MELVSQTVVLGVVLGSIYGLLGAGLSLIFGVMRVVNFAHGAFSMVSGYAAYYAATTLGLPAVVALLAAVATGALCGYVTDAILLRPVHRGRVERPEEYTLILTFGLSILLTAAMLAVVGADFRSFPGYWDATLELGWFRITGNRAVALGVAVTLTALLWLLVYRTDIGRGWRALTQSPVGARVTGVDVVRLSRLAWCTAGALAGAAGGLLAPLYTVYPTSGDRALVKGFVVVILGGLGSISGPLAAGLMIGLVEAFGSVYGDSAYADAYGFGFMILVLLLIPTGLFGRKVRTV